jgi:hypothetical protein
VWGAWVLDSPTELAVRGSQRTPTLLEGVKKSKMANCRFFIFNGLERAPSPVFGFFHTFAPDGPMVCHS